MPVPTPRRIRCDLIIEHGLPTKRIPRSRDCGRNGGIGRRSSYATTPSPRPATCAHRWESEMESSRFRRTSPACKPSPKNSKRSSRRARSRSGAGTARLRRNRSAVSNTDWSSCSRVQVATMQRKCKLSARLYQQGISLITGSGAGAVEVDFHIELAIRRRRASGGGESCKYDVADFPIAVRMTAEIDIRSD